MGKTPLERDKTRLKVVHRQRVERQGDAETAPEFAAAGFAPEVLGSAAHGWQQLLDTEYESVVIAGWMTSALARMGAPLDLIGAFGRVVEDEIRHVDLCAQMVEAFGGQPVVPRDAPPPSPFQLTGEGDAEQEVIGALVGFFCVFEQLSGYVFREAIDAADVPIARWALSEIFRDEAFHGAFGFEAAKIFVPRWTDAQRQALADRVAGDIARFQERIAGQKRAPSGAAEGATLASLDRLGLLSTERLLGVFHTGVTTQLVPRLQDLGVPIRVEPTETS